MIAGGNHTIIQENPPLQNDVNIHFMAGGHTIIVNCPLSTVNYDREIATALAGLAMTASV